jgi:putative aldouronate transport system permease protein
MTIGRLIFIIGNTALLSALALICILPLINVLALSFSSTSAIDEARVSLWPVQFTTKSYAFVASQQAFLTSMWVSLQRVLLGVSINMLLTILVAYPLSKEQSQFSFRTVYAWIFVFTILFSGGLIPTYIIIKELHLLDSIWSLILPGAVPIFNVILLLNFFRGLPKEISESAFIDGAGHWQTLWKVIVPLSTPSLATIMLFVIVGHWNEWFHGLIYMNDTAHYPLSSFLQTVVVQLDFGSLSDIDQLTKIAELNNRSIRAAQIFLAALPVLMVYPLLQRYFMSGIVLGSVKE